MTDDRKSTDPRIVIIDGETYYLTGEELRVNRNGDDFTSKMTFQKVRYHEPEEEMAKRNAELYEIVRLAGMGVTLPGITEDNFNAEYQGHAGTGMHNPCMDFPIGTLSTERRKPDVRDLPAHNVYKALEPGRWRNISTPITEHLRALGVPEGFIGWDRPPVPSAMQIQMDMLHRHEEDRESMIRAYQHFGFGLGNMADLNGAPPTYRDGWIQERLEDPNLSPLHRELYMDLLDAKERKMEFGSRSVDKKRKKLKRDGF